MKIFIVKGHNGDIYCSSRPYKWESDIEEWTFPSTQTQYARFIPGNLVNRDAKEIYEYLLQFVPEEEKPIELEI